MQTRRIIVLILANVSALAGIAYFASIDIRGIFAPLVFLTIVDAIAIARIFKPKPDAEPQHDD